MRFHHVGLACHDLQKETAAHILLGYRPEGEPFEDPHQQVRGCFLRHGPCRIELLAPLSPGSPLQGYLRRGIKMYHQAFEVDDLAAASAHLLEAGAKVASPPAPAVAFGGRKITFLLLRTQMLVELIATR